MIGGFEILLTQHNQTLAWHRNLIKLSGNTRAGKSYSKPLSEYETFTDIKCSKTKEPQQIMSQSPPLPLLLWRCTANQTTCHSAVSRAWLSAAWDMSTNINISSFRTNNKKKRKKTTNKDQHWEILSLRNSSTYREKRWQEAISIVILQSPRALEEWQVAVNSHNNSPRLKVEINCWNMGNLNNKAGAIVRRSRNYWWTYLSILSASWRCKNPRASTVIQLVSLKADL